MEKITQANPNNSVTIIHYCKKKQKKHSLLQQSNTFMMYWMYNTYP